MSATETGVRLPTLTPTEQRLLLTVAKASIEHGLHQGRPWTVDPQSFPPTLREPWAVFVTLHHEGRLRGCIGTLEPNHPLVVAVARFAWHAAFHDTRFAPLAANELPGLHLHLSILSPPAPIPCQSEADLLARLQPGVDGLLIEDGFHHATFLPSVWDNLPDKTDFLRHLKRKAGLSPDHWSHTFRASRYRALGFGADAAELDTRTLPTPPS
ncbi:AmmeMemoRadiSam system protein A [Fontisphaera persica]|uniref:AmmeMemoRadiSam system protein A n=1 Tax=Fontisphaera persica TaxID=2974023 RepID=UPI0024BFD66A|nr:AmmeMemoRadiSam system protein A [Fontisphaera persica]WCJ58646.1 AmmeMemoRadiSam system protein A [Fontisphaera persica]